jgi:hypothetical protein
MVGVGWCVCGLFIAINHQTTVGERLLSMGAPDSLVRHRTLSSAPATLPTVRVRAQSTVGAFVF